jgi:hypothetical protein
MIEGYCFTNLDEYQKECWPEQFVAVPRIGDRVQSKSGRTLKVVGITHVVVKEGLDYGDHFAELVPRIRIELHMHGG